MSKFVRRIVRQYVSAGGGTIIAVGVAVSICLFGLPTSAAAQASKLFCVLVPHFKDEYWLSIGFGLEQEAALHNVDLLFFEAGGYHDHTVQIDQLDACVAQKSDAILIGAVSSDHPNLTNAIERVARDVPVFALVNELHVTGLSGRIGVDWRDMGYVLGEHLRQRHPVGTHPKTAIFLTGPPEAGWTGPLEKGLRDGLAGSAVTILETMGADTGLRPQLALAEHVLEHHPAADYLIGNAPAVEAAMGLITNGANTNTPQLLATYVSHTIKRGLMNGSVAAASFDDPVLQARQAIHQAASGNSMAINPIGPKVVLLTTGSDNLDAVEISPADYFPTLQ